MRFFLLKTGAPLALCIFLLAQCRTAKTANAEYDANFQELLGYMTGDFSSEAQSKRDSDYFDIRLHIHPIWTADKANHWLYVEQATAAAQNKPYRQRVYKVERDSNDIAVIKSIVYTLPEPAKYIGGHKNTALFDQLKPADLLLREGCTVFIWKVPKNGMFSGATRDSGCESNLRGAKYATSKVMITYEMLESWDQGFNEKGEQVWGATKGGYRFIKQ